MAGRVVLKPSALPFLIVYIFRREAAWQMCEVPQNYNKETVKLFEKFSKIEDKYVKKKDKLECLEDTLWKFKEENINDADYQKLIAHIKNKVTIKNNSLNMNNMVAALILSVAGVILTVAELEGMKQSLYAVYMIVGLFVLVGCCFVSIPVIISWFGSKIKNNFYEICLNILE